MSSTSALPEALPIWVSPKVPTCAKVALPHIGAGTAFGMGALWGLLAKAPVVASGVAFVVHVVALIIFDLLLSLVLRSAGWLQDNGKGLTNYKICSLIGQTAIGAAYVVTMVALGFFGPITVTIGSVCILISLGYQAWNIYQISILEKQLPPVLSTTS
jgi:hypothetical protein